MKSSPIYTLRIPEVFSSLETSADGLSMAEAMSRRSLYGENILSERVKTSFWNRIADLSRHPFILISLVVILISLWQRDFTLAIIIAALALTNSSFSLWREFHASRATEKLHHLLPAHAHVIREGSDMHIPSVEIVPGDLLVLAEGDNIPADARIVEEYGLRVNSASLTGEAVATRKTSDASLLSMISELERPNLIFAGTSVISGTGKAVIYATGMLTQFGRIAHLTQTVKDAPSTYQKELEKLGRIITVVAIAIGVLVWVLSVSHPEYEQHFPNPLLLAIGTIIAITPEGLPATLTLSLAMAVQRLAGRGVLAKRLSIVETLGNVSIICTDKSGTLTQNQMTVREIWVANDRLQVTGVGYEPKGNILSRSGIGFVSPDLTSLLTAVSCCNNARLIAPSSDHPYWTSLGDQTEAALKVAALKAGISESSIVEDYERVHEIPFDAHRKRMTTIHRTKRGNEIAFTKGAPREIIQMCTHILVNGVKEPLSETQVNAILKTNDEYARRALRVLAVSQRDLEDRLPYSAESVERGLTFLGLMAMMDPPRPEVERAIHTCKEAGIRIAMITGDYGLTAESLARRVGMITEASPLIITGAELDKMPDQVLKNLLGREVIFARMAPEHKLRLVAAYQANGEVVAVTGDGVNDVPALRKADVGVAMGLVGTDVAKEAADIILTDDNFGSIVAAIEEGRAIYENIRKFVTYIFSSNVPEVLPFLFTSALGVPPALSVRQILAIDMGTDILPAIALGTEKPEPGIMQRPPRRQTARLIDRSLLTRSFLWLGLLETLLCYLGYLAIYIFSGNADMLNIGFLNTMDWPILFPSIQDVQLTARTVYFAGVVFAQIGNVFACRTTTAHNTQMGWGSNKTLLAGVVVALFILSMLIFVPELSLSFDNQIFPPILWLFLFLYSPLIYGLDWLRKRITEYTIRKREVPRHAG